MAVQGIGDPPLLHLRILHRQGLELGQAGAGRDQVAHDHVFLQAPQLVALAPGGRVGQHPGGLLEAGRADEAVGASGWPW